MLSSFKVGLAKLPCTIHIKEGKKTLVLLWWCIWREKGRKSGLMVYILRNSVLNSVCSNFWVTLACSLRGYWHFFNRVPFIRSYLLVIDDGMGSYGCEWCLLEILTCLLGWWCWCSVAPVVIGLFLAFFVVWQFMELCSELDHGPNLT